MTRKEEERHNCSGYRCPNEGNLAIIVHGGGLLGYLCDRCAEEQEHEFEVRADINRKRYGAPSA